MKDRHELTRIDPSSPHQHSTLRNIVRIAFYTEHLQDTDRTAGMAAIVLCAPADIKVKSICARINLAPSVLINKS